MFPYDHNSLLLGIFSFLIQVFIMSVFIIFFFTFLCQFFIHSIFILEFEKCLSWILDQGGSVNFYMFHGGTNFGFMAGANEGLGATNEGGNNEPYSSDITSYGSYFIQISVFIFGFCLLFLQFLVDFVSSS